MNNSSSKRYAPLELKQISQVFASKYTGDNKDTNYFTGEELVSFFNSLGFKDDYVYENGGIIADDFENRPSRLQYALARLRKLNEEGRVDDAILCFINIAEDKSKAKHDLSMYSERVIFPTTCLQDVTKTEDVHISEIPRESKFSKESIFDNVPEDHPVVFISYSWEDDDHKEWVKK